ncbi:MAG: hypothetical protein LC126_27720 [Bryobacterales bacterium]|nr:hypothetical protein [Bryobacterales bacterium]
MPAWGRGIRVVLQAFFDVKEHLAAWWLKLGYFALTLMFAAFTIIYSWGAMPPAIAGR